MKLKVPRHIADKTDKISLSYWFPILEKANVPVPKTQLWVTDADFWPLLDGMGSESANDFLDDLRQRANEWGYPLFLRTGHTSAKHSWKRSCFIEQEKVIGRNIFNIIEYSAMMMPPLPLNTWAIREFLDLDVHFTAFWGEMPIATEFRYFIEGGEIICYHPYWPEEAFKHEFTSAWKEKLEYINSLRPPAAVDALSKYISELFDGAWSLDWARCKNGDWYAIDMAPAGVSYHWPSCDKGGG